MSSTDLILNNKKQHQWILSQECTWTVFVLIFLYQNLKLLGKHGTDKLQSSHYNLNYIYFYILHLLLLFLHLLWKPNFKTQLLIVIEEVCLCTAHFHGFEENKACASSLQLETATWVSQRILIQPESDITLNPNPTVVKENYH